MKTKMLIRICASLLLCAMALNFTSCTAKAEAFNLLNDITANKVNDKSIDEEFTASAADFALNIFQKSITEDKNSLISPLSVMLALAMVANGADGQTKEEIETLLGGNIKLNELNEYLHTYVSNLSSYKNNKIQIVNSIWFRDNKKQLSVEKDFLQINADYYGAEAYKSAFDKQTLNNINDWVKKNTDGMIDKILDKIEDDDVMYLINALVFDAEWENPYEEQDIKNDIFYAIGKENRSVEMMQSVESRYIDTEKAIGFIKSYKDYNYSFAALIPNEDIDINDYASSLTGEEFMRALSNAKSEKVLAWIPKFSFDYKIEMSNALSVLGMPTAFKPSSADFSKLGHSKYDNIFIGSVVHKTFIAVDGLGTKAGAVTSVLAVPGSPPNQKKIEIKRVKLDRPFVYAIVDDRTKLPIFIGTVMDIQK